MRWYDLLRYAVPCFAAVSVSKNMTQEKYNWKANSSPGNVNRGNDPFLEGFLTLKNIYALTLLQKLYKFSV